MFIKLRHLPALSLSVFLGASPFCATADSNHAAIEHYDQLISDPGLNLKQLVDIATEVYPKLAVAGAMEEEAGALKRRGDSWMPGYPQLYAQYIDDSLSRDRGIKQVQTGIQMPLWMWGQKAAGQHLAEQAATNAAEFQRALRYEVAGLVRELLWEISLAESRYHLAKQVYDLSTRLTDTVRLRVDAGDLARADLLLAQSDNLEKLNAFTETEANLMHARQAYINLTRQERIPGAYDEQRSPRTDIGGDHPALAAASTAVERARAELEWVKKSKQGNQPTVLVGTQHDWFQRGQARDDSTNLVVQVPFGGSDYNAPVEADANVKLSHAIADRDLLARQLERSLHEAKHHLEVDKAQLGVAVERKKLAERHFEISRTSFEAGEMELLDLLKIESAARTAIRDAELLAIQLKRDTARYNQVVGEMP
ncbi:TolC family protein [Methylogaea oryzae]|uniref:TolC family protein n=1 Tax=Methylogaea oryzae TaxID=1295382 RepID=A0A8D4VKL5_9GAMM|nr:TolC family protein [Methylogaea oryzae]BBL69485.1 hypothetical protein MoryE10_00910 [Methylogaea oryzae]